MATSKSIKDVIATDKKIADLKQEILNLQAQEKLLHQEKIKQVNTLISEMDILSIPSEVLIGSFIHTLNCVNNNSSQIGEWQHLGASFLKTKKGPKKNS